MFQVSGATVTKFDGLGVKALVEFVVVWEPIFDDKLYELRTIIFLYIFMGRLTIFFFCSSFFFLVMRNSRCYIFTRRYIKNQLIVCEDCET